MERKIDYALSTGCFSSLSKGPEGYRRVMDIALEAGYSGIQALPFKGWDQLIREPGDNILTYEDSWCSGSFWEIFTGEDEYRRRGIKRTLQSIGNWWVFRDPMQSAKARARIEEAFPEALHTCHILGDNPVEIRPEVSMDHEVYINNPGGVVVDVHHLTRADLKDGNSKIAQWPLLLERLPDEQIKAVHVHITKNILDSFMRGENNYAFEVLRRLNGRIRCPVVMETSPIALEIFPLGLVRPSIIIERARQILDITKEQLSATPSLTKSVA